MDVISTLDKSWISNQREQMQNFSARTAKNEFGRLIDTARAEPVTIEKHGRPVVVVCSVEEFARLKDLESSHPDGNAGTPK